MSFSRPAPLTREQRIAARQAPIQPSTVRPVGTVVMGGTVQQLPSRPIQKLSKREKVRQDIRDSARGEECTVRIPGACWGDVIWSHGRWQIAGKGGATKALDLCGAYACLGCDAVYDGQKPLPPGITREEVDMRWCMGHFRSLVRLAEKSLI